MDDREALKTVTEALKRCLPTLRSAKRDPGASTYAIETRAKIVGDAEAAVYLAEEHLGEMVSTGDETVDKLLAARTGDAPVA
jgi:uncharacterized protein (DUF1810 family)